MNSLLINLSKPIPPTGIRWEEIMVNSTNTQMLRLTGRDNENRTVGAVFERNGDSVTIPVITILLDSGKVTLHTSSHCEIELRTPKGETGYEWDKVQPFMQMCVDSYVAHNQSIHWMFHSHKSNVQFNLRPDNHFSNLTLRFPDNPIFNFIINDVKEGHYDENCIQISVMAGGIMATRLMFMFWKDEKKYSYEVYPLDDDDDEMDQDDEVDEDEESEDIDQVDEDAITEPMSDGEHDVSFTSPPPQIQNDKFNTLRELESAIQDIFDKVEPGFITQPNQQAKQFLLWHVMSKLSDSLLHITRRNARGQQPQPPPLWRRRSPGRSNPRC